MDIINAIKILNESSRGVATINEEYKEACKLAVLIMHESVRRKYGKMSIRDIPRNELCKP